MAEISRRTLFNRTLLAAGVGVGAVLGLTRTVHHKLALPPPAPPAALLAALDRQRALLAGYDKIGTGSTGSGGAVLPALRSDVVAHGDALRGLLELYPGWRLAPAAAGPPAGPVPATVGALAAASTAAAAALVTSCTRWPAGEAQAGEVVPVLGSIAACLSTHATVLA